MFGRRKSQPEVFTDPLAVRVKARMDDERKRRERRDMLWQGVRSGAHGASCANSGSSIVQPLFWLVLFVGAVIVSVYEEIDDVIHRRRKAKRQKIRKRSRVKVHFHEV